MVDQCSVVLGPSGTDGCMALAECISLSLFPSLRYLSLSHNSVDTYSSDLLREVLGRHCVLEV